MKKYEFTEESKEIKGHILRRIKAIRDFEDVKAGDLGGWIEKEENLSHKGTCWVYDNACVYENAKIYEDAEIFGDAEIHGDAEIWENAKIYGNARIWENAKIWGSAEIHGNATIWGNAKIWRNANILGNAKIYGDAKIFGDAKIWGDAKIYGDTEIFGITRIRENANIKKTNDYICIGPMGSRYDYTTFYRTETGDIWVCCGCFNDSIERFKLQINNTHSDNVHAKEYLLACQQAELRFSLN